ncbi:hypothetical protein KVR01_004494 [Diaporthe batatas]|uniref:uncharacterized protein n=1 Tax=Diaporthe batatas TaxID=748121 RepID=UPI001D03D605|nr:uncharacterized protein KVR01_004494 [Diaporthe batatas]KAG8165942.1 hypothetical protein KVR01_004494 [Diaporthe batatas]
MPTALAVAQGVFAPISVDHTAFAPFTVPMGVPLTRKKSRVHFWDSYFKIYTGLDHGDNGIGDSGGDLPDIQMFDYYGQWLGGHADPALGHVSATRNGWAHGTPNCLWIDRDGGQPATAFQVNWPELLPTKNDSRIGKSVNSTGICQTPAFHIHQRHDPTTINYNKPEVDSHGRPKKKPTTASDPGHARSRRAAAAAAAASLRFQRKYSNMLVINDLDEHRAHDLCGSTSSAGPNFLNPKDGFFCEMQTKTVYPVCTAQNHTSACFDTEQGQLGKMSTRVFALNFQFPDGKLPISTAATTRTSSC